MRSAVLILLLSYFTAQAQTLIPQFDPDLVRPIYIHKLLISTPTEYQIKTSDNNKDSVKLILSPLIRNYYLENGKVFAMEVIKNGRPYKFYQLDENMRLIEFGDMTPNTNTPRIVYEYNDKELRASETVYRYNNTIHSKTVIRYNSSLQLTAQEEYSGETKLDRFGAIITTKIRI